MRMTLRIRQNHSNPTHAVPTALILKEPDGKTLKYQFGTLRIYRNKDLIQVQADEITVNPQVAETLDYIRTHAEEAQIQNMQTEKHDHTQYYLESAAIHEMKYAPNTTKTRITKRTRAIGIPVNRKPIPTTVKGVIHANITELR